MSAIVLAALVLMWAVVLVPMLLRRQERTRDAAAARRFAGAMRVLSRRRRDGLDSGSVPAGRRNLPLTALRRVGALSAERRAAVISAALAGVPSRPTRSTRSHRTDRFAPAGYATSGVSSAAAPSAAARRRAERVAARRRGLAVLAGAFALTTVLALLLGGWLIAVQGLTDVLVLAGVAQLRASTVADRAARGRPQTVRRPEAPIARAVPTRRVVPARVAPAPEWGVEAPTRALADDPAATTPVVRRAGKQIVFDAVTEMPIVERPRLREPARRPAATQARRVRGDMPTDFLELPASPPRPERVPLLEEVDTDPDTMTEGLELLDGILNRRASGE